MISMKFLTLFFLSIYIYSLMIFLTNQKMYLISLIILELIMLNSFIFMFYFLFMEGLLSFMLYFFIMVVCESCLGLSIFISMIRLNGTNMFKTSNFCLC